MTATVADNEELLRVEGVRKAFGQVVALKNAQFSLKRGSIHALCGGNGAGKSTFLSILMGFIRPDAGKSMSKANAVSFISRSKPCTPVSPLFSRS